MSGPVFEMGTSILLVVVVAIGLEVLAQVSLKVGTLSVAEHWGGADVGEYFRRLLRERWIRIGIVVYAVELVVGVAALTMAPLSVVFPLLSLSYCGVAVAGRMLLGEELGARNQVGILLITAGVAMVSWSAVH